MGTGGDMDKGSIDAAKMFSDPEVYDLLAFHDEQSPERLFGYFVPGYMSLMTLGMNKVILKRSRN